MPKNNKNPEMQNNLENQNNIDSAFSDLEKKIQKEKEEKEKKALELRKILTSKELKTLIEGIESQKLRNKLKLSLDQIGRNLDDIGDDPEKLAELAKLINEIRENNIESTQENLADFHKKLDSYTPRKNEYLSSKLFNKNILNRAENPKNILDQALGLIVGIIDSIAVIGNFSKDLVMGIISLPKDIIDEIKSKNTK